LGPWSIPSGSPERWASASQDAANSGANLSIAVSLLLHVIAHYCERCLRDDVKQSLCQVNRTSMNQWLDPRRITKEQARRVKHRRNLWKLSY
jgi:hypothetical protein